MTRLRVAGVVASAFLVLITTPVTVVAHFGFNPDALLDTSQVIDTRDVWGEVICPRGATPDNDPQELCTVDSHPVEIK